MLLVTVGLLVLLVVLVWTYSRWCHKYWQDKGVPVPPGYIPVFGHSMKLFSRKEFSWEYLDKAYKHHGGSTFCGLYEQFAPQIMIGDPDLIKNVLIKDFDHFVDRRNFKFTGKIDEIFQDMLTNAAGSHWKGIRSVLSPSFTSGRMKGMFPLVAQKADVLVQFLNKIIDKEPAVKLKKNFGNYTLEVIASCAFGMETSALEDENSQFAVKTEKLMEFNASKLIKGLIYLTFPKLCQALKVNFSQVEILFFRDVVLDSIKQRDDTGMQRGDFLDLMMQARQDQNDPNSKAPKYPLTDNTIVAESLLFILAGYDTTANTLSFITFLLAKFPEIQTRLREEMRDLIHENGELTYQGIMEAKYLDACFSETLRMYSPASITERQCTKEYVIPGTDIQIPEGMIVKVPIYSLHHDERFWSEPEEFRPERFMPENKDDIKSGTYMPFGLGPRNCIGMRFALMEAKLAIAKILLNFDLSCVPGKEELELSRNVQVTRPSDDLSVVFTPISEE